MSEFSMRVVLLVAVALLQQATWTDSARHEVRFITVAEGVRLELLDFGGTGRPIVLLAGLGHTAHVYDEFAPKVAGLGHVYALTRRGYGASSRPEAGYDVATLGEDVLAAVNSLSLEQPVPGSCAMRRWSSANIRARREIAVRSALGANRARIIAQLEALVLASVAAAVGLTAADAP